MENQSDHDLLIALNTKMELMYAEQRQFHSQWISLVQRVTEGEIEQGRQTSRLDALEAKVDDLRKKSGLADAINTAVAAIAGVIGFFFGGR
jgi:hypothetical protein